MELINTRDLDVIFLCFDEPLRENFFQDLVSKTGGQGGRAKKLEGVVGWDAAHKAAAELATTERFILVDGDGLVNPDFFNLSLRLPTAFEGGVLSFSARNVVNELCYGYGGLKIWTREFIRNMQTHENSSDPLTQFEFCYLKGYHHFANVYNATHINQSAQQAFRAGFREAAKIMSPSCVLRKAHQLAPPSLRKLAVWCTVGLDTEYGQEVVLGARHAVEMIQTDKFDPAMLNSYSAIDAQYFSLGADEMSDWLAESLAILHLETEALFPLLTASQSEMYKKHFKVYRTNAVNPLDVCKYETE